MSNSKTQAIEPAKPAKKYTKTRGEHVKDILIAVLVTGILAFIAGMYFANQQNSRITSAVKAVAPSASAQSVTTPVKK
jgi:uncharacterized protein HemX